MSYAVVDLETTGLRAAGHDRIVEIAIVQMDAKGKVESEWCTLVNPERDLGPQHIHGISALEAREAPTFKRVAGTVVERLRGRVLVAHNLHFDIKFLVREYQRLGFEIFLGNDNGLCTMRLAGQFLPPSGRGLADCCALAGIDVTNAHAALPDARATANLLAYFLSVAGTPPPWRHTPYQFWPDIAGESAHPVLRRKAGQVESHFVSRLVERLPRTPNPQAESYLDVLDRALLDRHISAREADALVAVATDLGLDREGVLALHRDYLQALATVAVSDGVLTAQEVSDLETVAALLGLGGQVQQALRTAEHAVALISGASAKGAGPSPLRPGDIVVFTGHMQDSRDVWAARVSRAGLRVGAGVTKQTRMLVAADPDSMSGKAQKAERYGIPIVHPRAFSEMLSAISSSSR